MKARKAKPNNSPPFQGGDVWSKTKRGGKKSVAQKVTEAGLRYNTGKTRHDLLEPFAMQELAKVFCAYKINPALQGMPWSDVIHSLKQHLTRWELGEDFYLDDALPQYNLYDPFAMEQLAKVFTFGSQKYAPHNWLKGMSWSTVLGCLKRHLNQYELCKDFDDETKLFHMAHVVWNALAIVSYYKYAPQYDDRLHNVLGSKKAKHPTSYDGKILIMAEVAYHAFTLLSYYKYFPQYDDRLHTLLPAPKIGLDIDELFCDWTGPWAKRFGHPIPKYWNFSYSTKQNFEKFTKKELEKFYLGLPAKINPEEIPFEPHCYITSRSVPVELTMQWIEQNGYAAAPVYSVGFGQSKVDACKKAGIDIFCDDSYENYLELNRAGICCFLYDAPHNRRYNVGYKRIYHLKELLNRW